MRNPLVVVIPALLLIAGCSSLNPFAAKPKNSPAALVSFTPTMAVRILWSQSIGKAGDQIFKPAVNKERIFAANQSGEIVCIDATNGSMVWKTKTGMSLSTGVGADDNVVVVASSDGLVLALDAATGQTRWKHQASTEILSLPAVGNGTVVVRSVDNRIVALDAESGARRWYLQRNAPSLALRSSPGIVVDDGLVYVGLPAGRLLALSVLTGSPRWEAAIAEPKGATELERVSDVSGEPVLLGRDICASTYQGRVACVDVGNGTLRWARELSAAVGPGIDQRYVFTADEKGNLQAFARENGSNVWRNTSLSWRSLSAPVSFGRAVAVGDSQGYLHFFSREEGALLARLATDGSAIRATPVVAGSQLIVQTQDGKLMAIASE
ncbi:MAG: outer membrane protein assembly factor BamB [Oxalobacteraceae bacterium]|nr:outer membrane protein assembly factor BamB [Oxalobacteraceae bacterium]